tara:strand:- start:191 stop:661 length:471 start_codon:yes stop_codon:yes gene_type:complete
MKTATIFIISLLLFGLSSCGISDKKLFGDIIPPSDRPEVEEKETIMDLFQNKQDSNTAIGVNRYIWIATLDVLSFLPLEAADPFTGVISFGYGKVPGSNKSYRGTILINDPALDARSLKVLLSTKNGTPIDTETRLAVENAILNRARQIYQKEEKL